MNNRKKTLVLAAALAVAPFAQAAFKCVDGKGVTHFGDTPPPGCADVVMYEVSAGGKVVRTIDPTPSEEQLKARAADYERAKAAIRNEADQKRKDLALINTYTTEREIDTSRDRQIEPLKNRIGMAQDRMKAIDKRQQELEAELEFYKAGKSKSKSNEPPPQLTGDMLRLKNERAALEKSISASEKDIETLRVKYDTDRRRWSALKAGMKPGDIAPADAASVAAKPADTAPATSKAVKKN